MTPSGGKLRLSLLWKILLATTLTVTVVLAFTGWLVREQMAAALTRDLEASLRGGFEAYTFSWKARADNLRSISMVLSTMSDVRAAFQTNDGATIRDTAGEIWSRVSQSGAIFIVTDPQGKVIASLGGSPIKQDDLELVRTAEHRFPDQVEGFSLLDGALYELVITPVYVQTTAGPGLLNVLVAGFLVDQSLAEDLKKRTGDSDFIFRASGAPVISTMPPKETSAVLAQYRRSPSLQRIELPADVEALSSPLNDIASEPIGDLLILRSYQPVRNRVETLQRRLLWIWGTAILAAALVSYLIALRILQPVQELDRAAARIGRQDYSVRVPESGNDELGRLARSFNQMSASIQDAREDLIRHERIHTIARLATSIIHDLRNPLAAIYGGAEMMVDGDLSEAQMRRVAQNIYRSSRVIKDLLQELSDLSRGRMQTAERCALREVIGAAVESQRPVAEQQHVTIDMNIDPAIELPLERARIERVFVNLLNNALEAMPEGGAITVGAVTDGDEVTVRVSDTGPGIAPEIRDHLFQPFVRAGKNGLGLGLALSRQTIRAHGGDLWSENGESRGACFCVRFRRASAEPS
jgi:signal transduction histidine kinase